MLMLILVDNRFVVQWGQIVLSLLLELNASDVLVVEEYPDVFLVDLSGLPPVRKIEFTIDLLPSKSPISQPPHRMAPAKLQELRTQLQELVDTSFIRPSVSP